MGKDNKDSWSMPEPANDIGSPALQTALGSVRRFSQLEAEKGRDKLEIITDLMRGPDGATVEDVVALTGWPLILVEEALPILVQLYGGTTMTLANKGILKRAYKIEDAS